MILCFLLGALMCFPAASFSLFDFDLMGSNGLVVSFFMAFFVVGFGEEFCKYLVLVKYPFKKPSFNEPFDGIIYSVMISLGFASLERLRHCLERGGAWSWGITKRACSWRRSFMTFLISLLLLLADKFTPSSSDFDFIVPFSVRSRATEDESACWTLRE